MEYNSSLLTGYANLFEAEGLGVFDTSAPYPSSAVGIFIGVTADQPDRAVTLMTYPVEDTDLTSVITGLQIKFRGGRDPRQVTDLADAVYNLLHNRSHYEVGGVHVELSWRQSGAWMGQDANQRMERVENFYLRAVRASTHQLS